MPGYIAIGWTGGLSSRRFIGRYKSIEELRDLLKLDRLTSSALKQAIQAWVKLLLISAHRFVVCSQAARKKCDEIVYVSVSLPRFI